MSFPKGSEWRRWDLHLHSPYSYESTYGDWASFVTALKAKAVDHDIEVVGINDYFTVDGYERLLKETDVEANEDRPRIRLSNDKYLYIFPVVELRLDHFGDGTTAVNIHVVFNPKIKPATIRDNFLEKLNIAYEGTELSCKRNDLIKIGSGSVNKTAVDINLDINTIIPADQEKYIKQALNEIVLSGVDFENKAEDFRKLLRNSGFKESDFTIIIANRGHGGLDDFKWHDQYHQTGRAATIRKNLLHLSDACFSKSVSDREFLLGEALPNNMAAVDFKQKIGGLKPSIWGSDAHEVANIFHPSRGASNDYTWIKADPTFEGLQQILVEPKERVAIQATKPDEKEPYKIIKKITFSGSGDFHTEPILLNSNMCSIIGSRSSGKSALLAYTAHAIQPEDTIARQRDAQGENIRDDEIGPAAGKTWGEVSDIICEVEWASGKKEGGKVIYIPQNYLYSISNRPIEITNKIEPVLFKQFPNIKSQYEKTVANIESCSEIILTATNQWFDMREAQDIHTAELRDLGDKSSIQEARDEYQKQINELKGSLSITDDDLKAYQDITLLIAEKRARQSEIVQEREVVVPFLRKDDNAIVAVDINTSFSFQPSIDSLPVKLSTGIDEKLLDYKGKIDAEVKKQIIDYHAALLKEHQTLDEGIAKINEDNKDLIERNKQNTQLIKLVEAVNKQNTKLKEIEAKETQIKSKTDQLVNQVGIVNSNIAARNTSLQELVTAFQDLDQSQGKIVFGVEGLYDRDTKLLLAEKFNRQYKSIYLDDQQFIDIAKIRSEVSIFLESIYTKSQQLKTGLQKKQAAIDILYSAEEIRFTAVMEGDKIGGFERSTMTPGKRALFALTLMLKETDGAWPLLIDQPEDDLDSRSIYKQIVPYIIERKKERQIIMVSHNANLVIGADSEQIIVANKHADTQKNKENCTFDYLTGAMESSKPKTEADYTLDTCGIREHACEILDGGEEAFEKRKNKYRI
jgi:hypothetical protein